MAELSEFQKLEEALIEAGRALDYPRTPNLSVRVRAELAQPLSPDRLAQPRQVRWRTALLVAVAIIAALALLLIIPETREAIAQLLGLRTIRIIETTPTPLLSRATPAPTPTPGVVPFRQCCLMTLAGAQQKAHFKILLPSVEEPSQVLFQDQIFGRGSDAQQAVLVFGPPDQPRFVLYQAQWWLYEKVLGESPQRGTVISETLVNGQRALWLNGAPHILVTLDRNGQPIMNTERPINANTLIWETHRAEGDSTYRLETALSLNEAIEFAESLRETP